MRREPLHPGAQQILDDIDGQRFTALLTDQPGADFAVLERRHRARARVEDRIRGAKNTGARALPCDTFERTPCGCSASNTTAPEAAALAGAFAGASARLRNLPLPAT